MKWNQFWLTPASARPLAVLRIGVTAILLLQAYSVAPHFFQLYGSEGILQGTLRSQFGNSELPGVYELGRAFARFGVPEAGTLLAMATLYLFSLVSLLVGYQTKLSAVLVWASHFALGGGHVSSYGLDTFANITLFYFLWMPVGAAYSIDVVVGRLSAAPSADARVGLRILQLHLSIAYFACGVDKALGIQWWNGDAIWRSLLLPVYAHGDFRWLADVPWLPKVLGWGTLLVECGYPIGMWVPRLRKLCLVAIVGLHLGIFIFLGLHLFAAIMMVLSLSAFGVSPQPRLIGVPVKKRSLGYLRYTGTMLSRYQSNL